MLKEFVLGAANDGGQEYCGWKEAGRMRDINQGIPLNHQLVNIRGQSRPTCHPSGAFVVDSKLAGTTGKEGDTFSRISFGLQKS
jgi:hypothetical protein